MSDNNIAAVGLKFACAQGAIDLLRQAAEAEAAQEAGYAGHLGTRTGEFIQIQYEAALNDCDLALSLEGLPWGDRAWFEEKAALCRQKLGVMA